ncbi:peroxisomal acyl-coenzyme A oxidase 1-like [Diospyros lotus]|uniref:peroxisomal acyl-coenzyme A oxidase 1-like n=1 Tax=Diospyros lotus TaxID=55363 RepID=UPI0022550479|nr:peroxisomal acyl-coenzyme A oxidase 1-like [Diospyros lotus]
MTSSMIIANCAEPLLAFGIRAAGEYCKDFYCEFLVRPLCNSAFFVCMNCELALHLYCIPNVPPTARDMHHRHPLTLTSSPIKDYPNDDDDYADYYCDSCEKKRFLNDPSGYYCAQGHHHGHDGIEECRKLCGGHGYLCSSGLPELFAVYIPACTYEGDNVVLLLQVARFLMKTLSQLDSGFQPVGTTADMGLVEHVRQYRRNVGTAEDWLNPSAVVEAFEVRGIRMSVACAQSLSKLSNPEEGFVELSADLIEAAVAHCQLIVVSKSVVFTAFSFS